MTKEIPLTQGQVAIVDDMDYEWLMQWKWYCNGKGYAIRNETIGKRTQRTLRMHNIIMRLPTGFIVDHINRNRLDNRRCNLRITTQAGNSKNASAIVRTSAYKGVHWHKVTSKWAAKIRADDRIYHLGVFTLETDAAQAYDHHARRLHGEYAVLNFPDGPDICPEREDGRFGPRGKDSPRGKLTSADVIAIRQRFVTDKPTLRALATEFGVCKKNVHYIVTDQTWKHVTTTKQMRSHQEE